MQNRDSQGWSSAIEAGLIFLQEHQEANGRWSDFGIAGLSDMWTTAYIASMVAEVEHPLAQNLASNACRWLESVPVANRWAYSEAAPRDADTTAWVLRLRERLRRQDLSNVAEYSFLLDHIASGDGTIATFQSSDFRDKFGRDTIDRSGWYSGHLCVTAAAAGVLGIPFRHRLLQSLRKRQEAGGLWSSYWWVDPEYTTGLTLEAFSRAKAPEFQAASSLAADQLSLRLSDGFVTTPWQPAGSTFATAHAVRGLVHAQFGRATQVSAACSWMVEMQHSDGSWTPSAALRLPYPNVSHPDDEQWQGAPTHPTIWNSVLLDQRALHTTATVVSALGAASDCHVALVDHRVAIAD